MEVLSEKSHKGGRSDRPPLFHYSKLFPGKILCNFCGLPFPPPEVTEQGVCIMCADEFKQGLAVAGLIADGTLRTPNRFNEVLKDLKQKAGPATVGVAESFLEECGGDEALGKMIAADLKMLRKDHITDPQLREFATIETDWKVVKGMYDIVLRFLSKRDELLQGNGPDLESMDEEDLLAIVSEAAMVRIEADPDFRHQVIEKVVQVDPDAVEQSLGFWKYGLPRPGGPSVRVADV